VDSDWFQGRNGVGGRAPASATRSILGGPPPVADMKDRSSISRSSGRGVVPALRSRPSWARSMSPEWFETDDDVPFMMKVLSNPGPDQRARIPAVDAYVGRFRGRLANRDRGMPNPKIPFRLINRLFATLRACPIVLNHVFSNENEPIVCGPEEGARLLPCARKEWMLAGHWGVHHQAVRGLDCFPALIRLHGTENCLSGNAALLSR